MTEEKKETCCLMRRKAVLSIVVLSEQVCEVPDSILADYMRWDLEGPEKSDGTKKSVLGFRFCPWCGKPFTPTSETRITEISDEESGEEWKLGKKPDEED